jgi:hypothetical protein
MKKFFIVLGSIFFTFIVLGIIAFGYIAIRGTALDKESKTYADSAIPAIVSTWSEKELLDRASSEFKNAVTIDQLDRMFHWFTSLGHLQKCEPAQGQAIMSATPQTGRMTTGEYTAEATFEKGEATIKVVLIKHGDQWQIGSFHVDSPALVPH